MWGVAIHTPTFNDNPVIKYTLVGIIWSLGVAGSIAFRNAKTTINPLNPAASTTLVTSVIYQITRNPMYVGFVIFLFAWSVYLSSVGAASLIVFTLPIFSDFKYSLKKKLWQQILAKNLHITKTKYDHGFIPITLEDARALAALTHPNHLLIVSSWGFTRLPPSCTSNSDGYR